MVHLSQQKLVVYLPHLKLFTTLLFAPPPTVVYLETSKRIH